MACAFGSVWAVINQNMKLGPRPRLPRPLPRMAAPPAARGAAASSSLSLSSSLCAARAAARDAACSLRSFALRTRHGHHRQLSQTSERRNAPLRLPLRLRAHVRRVLLRRRRLARFLDAHHGFLRAIERAVQASAARTTASRTAPAAHRLVAGELLQLPLALLAHILHLNTKERKTSKREPQQRLNGGFCDARPLPTHPVVMVQQVSLRRVERVEGQARLGRRVLVGVHAQRPLTERAAQRTARG